MRHAAAWSATLRSSLQRAILLARYAVFFNDPGIINTRYERIASLKIDGSPARRAAVSRSDNRTVVVTVPAQKTGA